MAAFNRFEEIEAWQAARRLTRSIYRITNDHPFRKDVGLCGQLRRASLSVMSNIAEGFERDGNREFHHFLSVAKGSCGEVRSQLYIAMDVGYLSVDQHDELRKQSETVSRLIFGLMRHLRTSGRRGMKYD